jgi:predicted transcriptional regulator
MGLKCGKRDGAGCWRNWQRNWRDKRGAWRREAREMKQNELNVDRVFQALGDPTRRAMLERLTERRPMSVSRLAEPFKMSLAAVVQHLQILEEAGLVKTEKLGVCGAAGSSRQDSI